MKLSIVLNLSESCICSQKIYNEHYEIYNCCFSAMVLQQRLDIYIFLPQRDCLAEERFSLPLNVAC